MKKFLSVLAFAVLAAAPTFAAPTQAPTVYAQLKPNVGAWAEYSFVTMKDGEVKSQSKFRVAVVGKTAEGIWLEERVTPEIPKPRHRSDVIMKLLMGRDRILKAYMKTSNGVVDMSAMMARSSAKTQASAASAKRTKVGSETITVPAGKFKATHYTVVQKKVTADVWIKNGAGPWGMIKQAFASNRTSGTMELLASGNGAKSEVDETTARAFPSMNMGMGRPSQASSADADSNSNSAPVQTPSAGSVIGNALKSHFGL